MDCKGCPLKEKCIGKSYEKSIRDSIDKPLYDKMHAKMQTEYAKRITKIRSATVEPVLGTLINFLNMKRVNTRGIKQANKHVLMASLTYNLKKYMKFIARKSQAKTIALKAEVCAAGRNVFVFFKTAFLRFITSLLPKPNFQLL